MANNPYCNKVQLADGTVLIDLTNDTVAANKMLSGYTAHSATGAVVTGNIASDSGTTITPTRSQQTVSVSGKYMTGNIIVAAIPNTYYTAQEALEMMFPIGSIYMSTSSTAPTFGGTWQEVIIKQTLNEFRDGYRQYFAGANTGNVHYWKRIS